jgi:hypothetical protein
VMEFWRKQKHELQPHCFLSYAFPTLLPKTSKPCRI